MFNLVTRFQAATNQALTASVIITGVVIALTILQLFKDDVWNLQTTQVTNFKPTSNWKYSYQYGSINRKPKENTKLQFNLKTDLSHLFNWNTKQIFIYLTAEYPGKSTGSSNKITYWDKIITNPNDAKLDLKNQKSKYSVYDVEKSFRERNATVRLEWNIQPHIGPLIYGSTEELGQFQFVTNEKK
ncbi:unnamed protein product [Candida verbasci]|uniref:Signal peptidase subunit 3 n=1 Tax=Candida verbasci TaxID=1227364 RepID=A0A9W4TSZ1_9ASCO|nr:unnamed protein product [Candida verbasci]